MSQGSQAAPTFSLQAAHAGDVLEVSVSGRIDSVEALIGMFHEIDAAAGASGLSRVLVVDHTQGVVPSEEGMIRLVSTMQGSRLAAMRLAYVDARGTAVGRMERGEIVGRERGYDCRVFGNEQAARIWLAYGAA